MSTISRPRGMRPLTSLRARPFAPACHPKGDRKTSTTAWSEHDGVVYTAYESAHEWPEWTDRITVTVRKGA